MTLQQGSSVAYTINARDPNGNRLTYRASSDNQRVATAWISGGRVSVTAGRDCTATITATDPGGFTATATIAVTVARAPDQWMAVAVTDLSRNCRSRGWVGFGGPYQSNVDAVNAALRTCGGGSVGQLGQHYPWRIQLVAQQLRGYRAGRQLRGVGKFGSRNRA